MRKFSLVAIVAACAAAAPAAFAAPAPVVGAREPSVVAVRIDPATLRSSGSVDPAYARLRRGAQEACMSDSVNRRIDREDRACAAQVLNQVVAQLNQPILTARHQADSGARFAAGY